MPKPFIRLLLIAAVGFAMSPAAFSQVSPEEHAKHHPQEGAAAQDPAPGGGGKGGMMGGGKGGGGMGGGGMGDMMKSMGVPPPKELYPSLMELPDLPLEKRAEVEQKAHERMKEGAALLSTGLGSLSRAVPGNDFRTMQEALEIMRQGLARFDSGLAAHRALAEGSAPRNVALQWFKREMNLLPPPLEGAGGGPLGLSWFHFFLMVVLIVFAAAMIWMYFLKMRRAEELLRALAVPGALQESAAGDTAPAAGAAAVPARRAGGKWSGRLKVCRIFQETHDIKTFRMVAGDGGALPFQYLPGQFLTLAVEPEGKRVTRSYTIASSPAVQDYLEISVKREQHGIVSRFLHDTVKEGDELQIDAPGGRFTFSGSEAESVVLIGGGVGITPMMSVIRYLTDRGWGGAIHLLYCCKTAGDIVFRQELEYLQGRNPKLNVVVTLTQEKGDDWTGLRGRLTPELIASSVPELGRCRIHICGPNPMMDSVKGMLAELGVPGEQVRAEAFGPAKRPKSGQSSGAGSPAEGAPSQASVRFAASDKTGPLGADETVLDVADALGVEIENSCRSGSCGSCKVKLLEGQVTMEVDDALDPDEKAEGTILACQARSDSSVVVDA